MGIFLDVTLLIIAGVLLAITAGFVAKSAAATRDIPSYSTSTELQSAHKYLTVAAVIAWIGVALIITLIVLYFVFGSETAMDTAGPFAKIMMFATLGLILIVGIISFIGAIKFHGTTDFGTTGGESAERDAIIATVLALGGAIIILLVILIPLFTKKKSAGGSKTAAVKGESANETEMEEMAKVLDAQKSSGGKSSASSSDSSGNSSTMAALQAFMKMQES